MLTWGDSRWQRLSGQTQKPWKLTSSVRQWAWRFEYPQSGVTSDTLILPLNKQAILYLRSEDVIHSFWVPEFRVKQDALPGGEDFIRDLRITPSMLGDYKVRCAELCGTQHAAMQSPVKVVSQDEFTEWLASQSVEITDPVAMGEKWVKESGCVACHSLDGSKLVGPTWAGLYGSQEELSDGSQVYGERCLYPGIDP